MKCFFFNDTATTEIYTATNRFGAVLENVVFVMKDGKVYKQAGAVACTL